MHISYVDSKYTFVIRLVNVSLVVWTLELSTSILFTHWVQRSPKSYENSSLIFCTIAILYLYSVVYVRK